MEQVISSRSFSAWWHRGAVAGALAVLALAASAAASVENTQPDDVANATRAAQTKTVESSEPTEYHARTWTTDDGLPHNSVGTILQDSTGFMWFATVGGLARYDGLRFTLYRPPSEYRTFGYNIRGIVEETPGTLLIIPAGSTLLRLTGDVWSAHPVNTRLRSLGREPAALHVDAAHRVWLDIGAGQLLRWNPDATTQTYTVEAGRTRPSAAVTFTSDASGGTWINADDLWFANAAGELNRVAEVPARSRVIAPARNGGLWVLSGDQLFQLLQQHVVSELSLPADIGASGARHLFEDSSGALWVSTSRRGLIRIVGGQLHRVEPYAAPASVVEDHEGNLWVATDGDGAGQLREKPFRAFRTTQGLRQEVVSAVAEDPDGRVWLANRSGGLFYVDRDGQLQPSGLEGTSAFANVVAADDRGRVWFGGGRNGLQHWTPGGGPPRKMPAPESGLHVLFRASNGDIWFAGDLDEVGYYRGDTAHIVLRGPEFAGHIRTIKEDAEGSFWMGGRYGVLLRWRDGQLERFGEENGFPKAPIHSISPDADGRLWIGTASGLVLKDKAQFHRLTEANGLADDIIEDVLDDGRGRLWFSSRRGLFSASKSDLLLAVQNPAHLVHCVRLGPHQGMIALTPTANYDPTALRGKDGRLWFATTQGAVAIDPTRLPRDLPAPPVLIDEVKVDGRVVRDTTALRIRSGRHRMEFRFAALSYAAPESVFLQHRLEGVDDEWVDTSPDRVASYTHLPPGNYRIHAAARNASGTWSADGAQFAFTLVPNWWETTTARVLVALLLAGLVAAVARFIAQRRLVHRLRILEQQHALEKERSRIARDLHDELGAGLTEVGLLADRLVETAPREYAPQLSGLAWRTRRLATDLSGIVWTMNASHASLDQLVIFLRRYAERLFRDTGVRCAVQGVETIPAIPILPEVQHHLLAVTKEALNNILKHARATEAGITFRYISEEFEVEIRDNGIGYTPDAAVQSDGNGMKNMRSRIEELRGVHDIESSRGAGARLVFRVPLAPPGAIT